MADESTRQPAHQSALLQAMQEQHYGCGRAPGLPKRSIVATQNRLEQEATHMRRPAHLLMEIDVDYPDREAERRILFETTGADETLARLHEPDIPMHRRNDWCAAASGDRSWKPWRASRPRRGFEQDAPSASHRGSDVISIRVHVACFSGFWSRHMERSEIVGARRTVMCCSCICSSADWVRGLRVISSHQEVQRRTPSG